MMSWSTHFLRFRFVLPMVVHRERRGPHGRSTFSACLVIPWICLPFVCGCDQGRDSPPDITEVRPSLFSEVRDEYAVGSMVRIDIVEGSGEEDIIDGTIRITSASTGYDSGLQPLSFGSIFYNWDTTGLD